MAEIDVAQPEFSLRPGSGEDWLSLDLKLSVGGKPIPLDQSEIQRWLQTGQTHARTGHQARAARADRGVERDEGSPRRLRSGPGTGKDSRRADFRSLPPGALTAQGFLAGENAAADSPPPDVKAALDKKLWTQLRPYQAQGVEWLASLAQRNFHGLLADDMGLGKTLQALAFCAWLKTTEVSHGGEGREEDRGLKGRQ